MSNRRVIVTVVHLAVVPKPETHHFETQEDHKKTETPRRKTQNARGPQEDQNAETHETQKRQNARAQNAETQNAKTRHCQNAETLLKRKRRKRKTQKRHETATANQFVGDAVLALLRSSIIRGQFHQFVAEAADAAEALITASRSPPAATPLVW